MDKFTWLNKFEPARLRAVWVAVIALLGTLGVSVTTEVDATVTSLIAFLVVVVPILQGELTRGSVYAPATVERLEEPELPVDETEFGDYEEV